MLTCGCLAQKGLDIYKSPEMFISESKSLMYKCQKSDTKSLFFCHLYNNVFLARATHLTRKITSLLSEVQILEVHEFHCVARNSYL